MSVGLMVMRPSGAPIGLPEWTQIVAVDSDLRIRAKPYEATNPKTGEVIRMRPGEADAELRIGDRWLPFLCYRKGKLTTQYVDAYDDAQNPARLKIAAIARQLKAVITTDAGDDLLNW